MLILLPIAAFAAIYVCILGLSAETQESALDWRPPLLLAATVWGGLLTLVTETLSLLAAINQLWLSLSWLAVLLLAIWLGVSRGWMSSAVRRLGRGVIVDFEWDERFILAGVGIISLSLLVVALVSPPNNADSLLYHMSRVVHWAEDHSLRHYPTAYNHQLRNPIWAETAILNLRVLWGNDRPANLVQWFSMLGSLVGVSAIAALLGAGRRGQILSAVAALSIPMGLLQATSTQNDYVTAFWVVSLAFLVVLSRKRILKRFEFLCLALVLGSGILTKAPFFVYALPLMLWFFLPRLRPGNARRLLTESILLILVAGVLNAGFWTRNIITYGGPYGDTEWLRDNIGFEIPWIGSDRSAAPDAPGAKKAAPRAEQDKTDVTLPPEESGMAPSVGAPGPSAAELTDPETPHRLTSITFHSRVSSRSIGTAQESVKSNAIPSSAKVQRGTQPDAPGLAWGVLAWWIPRMSQTIAWNLVTPSGIANEMIDTGLRAVPPLFGLGADFRQGLMQAAWNHEDTAGSPVHLLLVPLSLIGLVLYSRRSNGAQPIWYALVALLAYGLLPVVIRQGNSIWGIRFQLSFFVLWAPVIGVGLSYHRTRWFVSAAAVALLLYSLPYVLLNNTRPVIGLPPWPTRIGSIFATPQEDILLAIDPTLRHSYIEGANAVEQSQCRNVGLRLNSNDLEYAFWWLLGAPQSGIHLETIYTFPYLERYADPTFKPCAIICTICGDRLQIHGLPRVMNSGMVSVFVGPDYVPEKGD
jgi:hypothetical protein